MKRNSKTMRKLWEIMVPLYSKDNFTYPLEFHQKWSGQVEKICGEPAMIGHPEVAFREPSGVEFYEFHFPARIYCTQNHINRISGMTLDYYCQNSIHTSEIGTTADELREIDKCWWNTEGVGW